MIRLTTIVFFLLSSICFGQAESVVEVLENDTTLGRGVVIEKGAEVGHVVTAYHMVKDRGNIRVRFSDNTIATVGTTIHVFPDSDLAIVSVVVPARIKAVEIAKPVAKLSVLINRLKDKVELKRSISQTRYHYFDFSVVAGDSGCGIFEDGKLVAIVSGGWFWLEENNRSTWPTRAGRLDCIVDWLKNR